MQQSTSSAKTKSADNTCNRGVLLANILLKHFNEQRSSTTVNLLGAPVSNGAQNCHRGGQCTLSRKSSLSEKSERDFIRASEANILESLRGLVAESDLVDGGFAATGGSDQHDAVSDEHRFIQLNDFHHLIGHQLQMSRQNHILNLLL